MKHLTRLLPRRFATQLLTLVLLLLVGGQIISFWLLADERRDRLYEAAVHHGLQRLLTTRDLIQYLPASAHQDLLRLVSTPALDFTLSSHPLIAETQQEAAQLLQERFHELLSDSSVTAHFNLLHPLRSQCDQASLDRLPRDERRQQWRRCQPLLEASVQLHDQQWLNMQLITEQATPPWPKSLAINLLLTLLLALLLLAFTVHRLTRPLQTLTRAARQFSIGSEQPPLPEQGTEDLKEVIRAFNLMQAKVNQQLKERTSILAALSHDLRTPLTQMRLRLELLEDSQDKQRLLADLAEMERLAETSLDFVRGHAPQEIRSFDLSSLLLSLAEDYQEQGQPVTYRGPEHCLLQGQPRLLKRALHNLLDNALKYAGQAELLLQTSATSLQLLVRDQGAGIAAAEREKVFAPFYRLDDSRSQETGGTGLGLSIARNLIEQCGGSLSLHERSDGQAGLEARIELPIQPQPTPQ